MTDSRVVALIRVGEGLQAVNFKDEAEALAWLNGPGAAANSSAYDVVPVVSRRSVLRHCERQGGGPA